MMNKRKMRQGGGGQRNGRMNDRGDRNGGRGRQGGGAVNEQRLRRKALDSRDRYLNLAREAMMSGDRVRAENFFQHADHYYRVIRALDEREAAYQQSRRESYDFGDGGLELVEKTLESNGAFAGDPLDAPSEPQQEQEARPATDQKRRHYGDGDDFQSTNG